MSKKKVTSRKRLKSARRCSLIIISITLIKYLKHYFFPFSWDIPNVDCHLLDFQIDSDLKKGYSYLEKITLPDIFFGNSILASSRIV